MSRLSLDCEDCCVRDRLMVHDTYLDVAQIEGVGEAGECLDHSIFFLGDLGHYELLESNHQGSCQLQIMLNSLIFILLLLS